MLLRKRAPFDILCCKENLKLLVTGILAGGFVVLFWPVSIIPIMAFLPVLVALLITNIVNPVLDEHLIRENEEEEI